MRYFIDHNVAGPAIALLGGIEDITEITHAPRTANLEFEVLRNVIMGALSGEHTLVYSDNSLETLRRLLVAGGNGVEAIDPQTAVRTVAILRYISQESGGLATSQGVRAHLDEALHLTRDNVDRDGKQDLEDAYVVSTVLAAAAEQDQESEVTLFVTNDTGIKHCSTSLLGANILVVDSRRSRQLLGA